MLIGFDFALRYFADFNFHSVLFASPSNLKRTTFHICNLICMPQPWPTAMLSTCSNLLCAGNAFAQPILIVFYGAFIGGARRIVPIYNTQQRVYKQQNTNNIHSVCNKQSQTEAVWSIHNYSHTAQNTCSMHMIECTQHTTHSVDTFL